MQRRGVMHARMDKLMLFEILAASASRLRRADGVTDERHACGLVQRNGRCSGHIFNSTVGIALRQLDALFRASSMRQFNAQDRGLQVRPAGRCSPFLRAGISSARHDCAGPARRDASEIRSGGEHGASVAVGAHVLGRVKTQAGQRSEACRRFFFPLYVQANRLGHIFDQAADAASSARACEGFHVRHLSVQVHRDDRPGARRDPGLSLPDIDVVGCGIDVDEDRAWPLTGPRARLWR